MSWGDTRLLAPGLHLRADPRLPEDQREVQMHHRLIALARAHGWASSQDDTTDDDQRGTAPADLQSPQQDPQLLSVLRTEQLSDQADEARQFLEDLVPPGYSFYQTAQGDYGVYRDDEDDDSWPE